MLKWVILAGAAYMLYRMFESEKRKRANKAENDTQKLVATGELVKDPVCGTYVESASAISVREGNAIHHFCSYACRDNFLRSHGKALSPESEGEQPTTMNSATDSKLVDSKADADLKADADRKDQ